ncbi:hypothetical protein ABBQ38_008270 [Trebouxia sp. C0009 RCD-2024]
MRRGWTPAVALFTKRLRDQLRPGKALKESKALIASVADFAWPLSGNEHKHHWSSFFSTHCQHLQQEGPDISLLEPMLQRQWDHAANAHLGNTPIKVHSRLKVWWTCDQCPDGPPAQLVSNCRQQEQWQWLPSVQWEESVQAQLLGYQGSFGCSAVAL